MDKLEEIVSLITPVRAVLTEKAREKLDLLEQSRSSLGMLEDIATKIVSIRGDSVPRHDKKVIFMLAGDHGISSSADNLPLSEQTVQKVVNTLHGSTAINVLARQLQARIVLADFGVAADLDGHESLVDKKIAYGTANIAEGAAMTRQEAVRSIIGGIELFENEFSSGIDLIAISSMGKGQSSAAAAICSILTEVDVPSVVGKGNCLDELDLVRKIQLIEKAIYINQPVATDMLDVLHRLGGFEIGGMAGIILAAAAHNIPVILDDFISCSAALIAQSLSPNVAQYMIAGQGSHDKGHIIALGKLGLIPLLDLNLSRSNGTGAALAMSIVESSVRIYDEVI
ncbi:nicotinate-nucleotide--dimethylbenzimidazole phosphoribosyltransferase [bacterium]|nr:nicotinate-nucleotide--dimethylbenzimidazole phosphoribosyltransferase [bacterium]